MPLIAEQTAENRFTPHNTPDGRMVVQHGLFTHSNRPLNDNILVALMLNETASQGRRGMFYWLPSLAATSQRMRRRRSILVHQVAGGEPTQESVEQQRTCNADLLYLREFTWSEDVVRRWQEADALCRQSLCQGQLNWWSGTPTLVLPVYLAFVQETSWYAPAGPRSGATNGLYILWHGVDDAYEVFADTLFSFGQQSGRTSSGGKYASF